MLNKAAVLYGQKDIRIEYRDIPDLGPNEILIKSVDVSICATEVKYWYHGIPGVPSGTKIIQGHELGGIVEDIGINVNNRSIIGAKVAVDPSLWCGICDMCRANMANLCRNLQFMSLPPVDGGFQQFYKVPFKNIHPIPKYMPMELSSLVEPLAVCMNAISDAEKVSGTLTGKTAAIIGAGPQGLLLIQALASKFPKNLCVIEPLDYRRKLAKEMGADIVIDPKTEEPISVIKEITYGAGIDIVFEMAGEPSAYQVASAIAKPAGIIIIVGIPVDQKYIPIQALTARRSGLTLKFVRRFNPNDLPKAINLLASGKIKANKILTHFFSLDEIESAFNMLYEYSDGVVKAVIHPND